MPTTTRIACTLVGALAVPLLLSTPAFADDAARSASVSSSATVVPTLSTDDAARVAAARGGPQQNDFRVVGVQFVDDVDGPVAVSGYDEPGTVFRVAYEDALTAAVRVEADGSGYWSAELPASADRTGTRNVFVSPVDEEPRAFAIDYDQSPPAAPGLAIATPSVPSTISSFGGEVRIVGHGSPGAVLEVKLDGRPTGDVRRGTVLADGYWELLVSDVTPGRHTLEVSDGATSVQSAIRVLPVEYTEPVFLTEDGAQIERTNGHVTVRGTTQRPGYTLVSVDGQPVGGLIRTERDGAFTSTFPATPGEHVIRLESLFIGLEPDDEITIDVRDEVTDADTPVSIDARPGTTSELIDGTITLAGDARPGASLSVTGVPNGVAVDANGRWEASARLPVGRTEVRARALGSAADPVTLTVTNDIDETGRIDATATSVHGVTTYTGTGLPGALVDISDLGPFSPDGVNTLVRPDGTWSIVMQSRQAVGERRIFFSHGLREYTQPTITVTEHEPERPAAITVSTKQFVRGQKQRIDGTATPNTTLRLYSGDRFLQNVVTNGAGGWTYTTGNPITADTFTRTLRAAGHADRTFTLRARAVQPITVTTKRFTKGQKRLIEGTATPGAELGVYAGSKRLITVMADEDGRWSYTTGSALTEDRWSRTLKAVGHHDVTFELVGDPAVLTVTTTSYTPGERQLIAGTAAPNAVVKVYNGTSYLMQVIADADGKWSYTTGSPISGDSFTRTYKATHHEGVTVTLSPAAAAGPQVV